MARTAAKGASGRKPQPANLRLLKGKSEGHDAAGRKVEEPPPFARTPPVKPEFMSEDAAWMWDRIVAQMETVQVLKPLDGPALEVACETFARWREAKRMRQDMGILASNSQGRVAAPWVGVEERAARDFRAWCAEFGITPAAEKNLITADTGSGGLPGGGDNPFA